MSRYIEIIFDNSGSMLSAVNDKPKHILAKEIFNEEVLPKLGKRDDELALRLLREGCNGKSKVQMFSSKRKLKESLNGISNFNNNTPLYLTIKDSIDACSKTNKIEKFIFILTDGDDNCSEPLEKILTPEELKAKEKINTEIILVQFAVGSKISRNNLTALSQKLKAKNLIINQNEVGNKASIKNKFTNALIDTGIDKSSKLDYCKNINAKYDTDYSWAMLELIGEFDFYLAELLYIEKLLSWKPNKKKDITQMQFIELEFLYTLRFKNNLPGSLVKQMLSQLKKPYMYCFDEIYWDFSERRWRQHQTQEQLHILDNPDAIEEDRLNLFDSMKEPKENEIFNAGVYYEVTANFTNEKTFSLLKNRFDVIKERTKTLKDGDIINFQ